MSTRACFRFIDNPLQAPYGNTITVYKHSDGYPEGRWGGIAAICTALDYAWELPRFEADEFAAAFVAGNKQSATAMMKKYEHAHRAMLGGDIRIINTPDLAQSPSLTYMPGDIQYLYDITVNTAGKLMVAVKAPGYGDPKYPNEMTAAVIASGTLAQMVKKFNVPFVFNKGVFAEEPPVEDTGTEDPA